jgi:hypothetical protein
VSLGPLCSLATAVPLRAGYAKRATVHSCEAQDAAEGANGAAACQRTSAVYFSVVYRDCVPRFAPSSNLLPLRTNDECYLLITRCPARDQGTCRG